MGSPFDPVPKTDPKPSEGGPEGWDGKIDPPQNLEGDNVPTEADLKDDKLPVPQPKMPVDGETHPPE